MILPKTPESTLASLLHRRAGTVVHNAFLAAKSKSNGGFEWILTDDLTGGEFRECVQCVRLPRQDLRDQVDTGTRQSRPGKARAPSRACGAGEYACQCDGEIG